jgi:hypothetical protein
MTSSAGSGIGPVADRHPVAVIQRTRQAGAAALATVLRRALPEASEYALAGDWLAEMRKDERLLFDGWYQPPPGGLSVLIGEPDRYARLMYRSLRDPAIWPRTDIALSLESLIYCFASPTDRHTGLIGDLGGTFYAGPSERIREHLSVSLWVSAQVAAHAQVGMEFRELYHYAQTLISKVDADLRNFVTSATDGGASNIGHTVPWSYEDPSPEAKACIATGDAGRIAELISNKRIFLNADARDSILPTTAFTVEPRIVSQSLPLTSFHLIVTFLEGRRSVCAGLSPIFSQFGMDKYLPADAMALLD